jgi:hypothetical protein
MKTHKHHIIPKHAGGTDDPSNFVELTVAEHAAAHKKLYEQYGRIQDKVAWMGLAKLAPHAELMYELNSIRMKGEANPMFGKPAPNRGIKRPGIGGRKKGTKWSEEERKAKMAMHNSNEHKEKMNKVYTNPIRNEKIANGRKGKTGAATGKVWFNNGIEEKYYTLGHQPEGYIRGRINKK